MSASASVWMEIIQVPLLGMLMMPKTLAYLGVAIIAYRAFFGSTAQVTLKPITVKS